MARLEFEFVSVGAKSVDNELNNIKTSFSNVNGLLKDNIKDSIVYSNALKEVSSKLKQAGGSNEYLIKEQLELKGRLNDVNATIRQQIKDFDSVDGSLVQLRANLSLANKAYDNLSKTARQGNIGTQLGKQIQSLNQEISKAEQATGRYQRQVGNYEKAQGNANGVAMEFNRIIQDAPFGMMGVGNNIQQLAANWQTYTTQAKAAATANGTTVTSMGLMKGALAALISPANLLTLGIAAVTSGWVLYEKWQQKANKATKEAESGLRDYSETLNGLNAIQVKSISNYTQEASKLQVLRDITMDNNRSIQQRKNALKELQDLYPRVFSNLDLESIKTAKATDNYYKLRDSILANAKASAAYAKIAEESEKQLTAEIKKRDLQEKISLANRQNAIEKTIKANNSLIDNLKGSGADLIDKTFFNKKNGKEFLDIDKLNESLKETESLIDASKANISEYYNIAIDNQSKINGLQEKGVQSTEKGNVARSKSVNQLKQAIDYLKELQSLSGVSEKDISLVGKVGLDYSVASIKFDYEERIKQIQTLQEQILADTTLTEAKRQELIEETNTYIAYLTGNVLANIKDLSNKATEYLDKMTVKAVKTYKDVEILESPKQKKGRNREDDKDWKDYANVLNQSINSIFTNLKSNIDEFGLKARSVFYALGESLGDLIKQLANKNTAKFMESITKDAKSFSDIKGNWQKMDSSQKLSAGLSFAGNAISTLSNKSNIGGQAIGGALSGAGAGTAILPGIGTAIGAAVGAFSGVMSAAKNRRQEKIAQQQLEAQLKANALLERMNALSYASQIIGSRTEYGIVTGVNRNEFGEITLRVNGNDLVGVFNRTNEKKGR